MVVSIWITNNCNMKCDYCYEGEKGIFNLSLQDFEHIKKFIYMAQEQTINFEFLKYFVENFNSNKVLYSVTTNGALLTGEILNFLIDRDIEIFVSVDGGEKIHNKHRKFKNGMESWATVKKNLLEALKKNKDIKVKMTYTPETVGSLVDSIGQILELGVKSIHLCPDYFARNWNIETFSTLQQEFEKIHEVRRKTPNIEILTGNYKETIYKDCSKCGGGENTFSISTEGDIYPCTYVVGVEKFRIGTIFDLKKIKWGSHSIDSSLRKKCKGCRYFRVCYSGRCIYLNYKMTQNLYIPNGFFCAYQKMEYKLVEEGYYD